MFDRIAAGPVRKGILMGGALALVAACTPPTEPPKAQVTPITGETVITATSSLSQSYILDKMGTKVVCAQPAPDAAYDQSEGGDFSIALINTGSDDGGVSEASEDIELAGRTPSVLITRELFFRVCEFSNNFDLTKEEALNLFKQTLTTVQTNWAVEAKNTTVTIGATNTQSTTVGLTGSNARTLTQSQSVGQTDNTVTNENAPVSD